MTISRESYLITDYSGEDKNNYSMSCTASAGQRIIVSIVWKSSIGSTYSLPSWNGQTFTAFTAKIPQGEHYFQSFYLDATTSATANITASADGYSQINTMFAVYSTTLGWAGAPAFSSDALSPSDDPYVLPSLPADLSGGKLGVSIFNGLGWSRGYGLADGAWTSVSPLSAIADVQNTVNRRVWRMYFGEASGSGSVDIELTPTGSEAPMWSHSVIVLSESANQITLPDDITLLTEYTDNAATGFADGAATLSYGGVNVAVTVASELFDFTLPMIAHDVVSPRLPAAGAEFTLTQGLISATDNANIFLPTGYDTTRVGDASGGDPANFSGIVDDDPTYLGYAFAQASNDLTTSDSAVFVTSDGYLVGRDTFIQSNEFEIDGITPVLPRTDDLYVWRASTGKYYEHTITMTDAGVVVEDDTPNSFTFTAVTNANTDTSHTSNEVIISGLGAGIAATLTVANGTYSKNGGIFTSAAGVISNGDTLKVRRKSSGSYSTAVNLDVTVGTYTTQFSITTKSDNDPDTIKFTTLSALSDIKTITGVTGSVAISVVGGQYSKNGGAFTSTAGTVVNDDTIQLSAANGATVRVTIGGKTFSWSSKGGGGGFGGSIGIGI